MSNDDQNTQNILMSPLLSERFNNIENKLESIKNDYIDINDKFNTILELLVENSKRWDENKKEYIQLLEKNHELSQRNFDILKENNSIFNETLKKTSNNDYMASVFDKLEKNNNKLINNIGDMNARYYNRYWRTSGNNTIMQPPLNSGISSILPWFSFQKK